MDASLSKHVIEIPEKALKERLGTPIITIFPIVFPLKRPFQKPLNPLKRPKKERNPLNRVELSLGFPTCFL